MYISSNNRVISVNTQLPLTASTSAFAAVEGGRLLPPTLFVFVYFLIWIWSDGNAPTLQTVTAEQSQPTLFSECVSPVS